MHSSPSPPPAPPLPAGASLPGASASLSASALANASAQDKDELRALRMRRSNGVRERLWEQFQKACFRDCDADIKAYWVCRQEAGLLAPLRCSAESAAMKGCLQACGKDEARFDAFKERQLAEWAAVRNRLGRPRVLSRTFLTQEREKLERYRADVRRVQVGLLPKFSVADGPFLYRE